LTVLSGDRDGLLMLRNDGDVALHAVAVYCSFKTSANAENNAITNFFL
jgi:hypothetical protein